MLYDTVGPLSSPRLEPDRFQSTTTFTANFRRPVRPGRIIARGRVAHRDGDTAFLEASLVDATGATIATATAVARVIPLGEARAAA
jgi:acyl-coenzyme A thioesterase PaaI-like protein